MHNVSSRLIAFESSPRSTCWPHNMGYTSQVEQLFINDAIKNPSSGCCILFAFIVECYNTNNPIPIIECHWSYFSSCSLVARSIQPLLLAARNSQFSFSLTEKERDRSYHHVRVKSLLILIALIFEFKKAWINSKTGNFFHFKTFFWMYFSKRLIMYSSKLSKIWPFPLYLWGIKLVCTRKLEFDQTGKISQLLSFDPLKF